MYSPRNDPQIDCEMFSKGLRVAIQDRTVACFFVVVVVVVCSFFCFCSF